MSPSHAADFDSGWVDFSSCISSSHQSYEPPCGVTEGSLSYFSAGLTLNLGFSEGSCEVSLRNAYSGTGGGNNPNEDYTFTVNGRTVIMRDDDVSGEHLAERTLPGVFTFYNGANQMDFDRPNSPNYSNSVWFGNYYYDFGWDVMQAPGVKAIRVLCDNATPAGNLTITKTLTGLQSGYSIGNFSFDVNCGADGSWSNEIVTTSPDSAGSWSTTINNIPAGASCTVSEDTPPSAPADHSWSSTAANQTVTISSGSTSNVSMANQLSYTPPVGNLTITKTLTGLQSGYSIGNFTFNINCGVAGSFNRTISAGFSVTISGIAANAVCTVSETGIPSAPADHNWLSTAPNQSVTISSGLTRSVTMLNRLQYVPPTGNLNITKTVTGGPTSGNFTVALDCSDDNFDDSNIELVDGQTHTVLNIPTGTTCNVTEPTLPPAPVGSYWQTPQITPEVTIGNGTIVSIEVENALAVGVDLVASKSASHPSRIAGETLVYTLAVTNQGIVSAPDVTVTDLLPAEVSYQSDNSTTTSTSYVPATGVWTIGTLGAGASISLDITTVVN